MILIYLSPNSWDSFSQRAHHCVEVLLGKLDHIIWVEPYGTRLPKLEDFKTLSNLKETATSIPDGLTLTKPPSLPIEPLPGGGPLNQQLFWKSWIRNLQKTFPKNTELAIGIGKPSQLALNLLTHLKPDVSFYDAMDDFPQFYSGLSKHSMATKEMELANKVDRILVSSHQLLEKFATFKQKTHFIPNACGFSNPATLHSLNNNSINTIGYIGTVAEWFDWDLIVRLAQSDHKIKIEIYGPVFSPAKQKIPDNVKVHPPCQHAQVEEILRGFDIGIIPFKITALTQAVDPIKYYEYRSMGLPVITTRFGEMPYHSNDAGLFFSDEKTSTDTILQSAFTYQDSKAKIISFRDNNNWSRRFSPLADWLD